MPYALNARTAHEWPLKLAYVVVSTPAIALLGLEQAAAGAGPGIGAGRFRAMPSCNGLASHRWHGCFPTLTGSYDSACIDTCKGRYP